MMLHLRMPVWPPASGLFLRCFKPTLRVGYQFIVQARREAVDHSVFESKRQETCALMAEKVEVCGTDCCKSATPRRNDLAVPRFAHDSHCQCGQEASCCSEGMSSGECRLKRLFNQFRHKLPSTAA